MTTYKRKQAKRKIVEERNENDPHSVDAEYGVLSCIVQKPELIFDARVRLTEEHFFDRRTNAIIKCLFELGRGIDHITLCDKLDYNDMLEAVGGRDAVNELWSLCPDTSNYHNYLQILDDNYISRKTLGLCRKTIEVVEQREVTGDKAINDLYGSSSILLAKHTARKVKSLHEQVEEFRNEYNDKLTGRMVSGRDYRWPCWNSGRGPGGQMPGYVLVGGGPSAGKTVLGGNMFLDGVINHGRPGAIKTEEMTEGDMIKRFICDISGIHSDYIFKPDKFTPDNDQKRKIMKASEKIESLNDRVKIIHDVTMRLDEFLNICYAIYAERGDILGMLDYLQILIPPKMEQKNVNDEKIFNTCSAHVRRACKELKGSTFITLTQVSRTEDGEPYPRGSKAPYNDCDEFYVIEDDDGVWVEKCRQEKRFYYMPIKLNGAHYGFSEFVPQPKERKRK